jgi:hypothetical protein
VLAWGLLLLLPEASQEATLHKLAANCPEHYSDAARWWK